MAVASDADIQAILSRLERLDAQFAGLVGIVAGLIEVAPEHQRVVLLENVHSALENLQAMLLTDTGPHSEEGIRGGEILREAFLGKQPK